MPDFDPFSWRSLAQSMRPPRESTRLCRRFRDSRLQARSGCAMIIGKRSIPNSAPRIGGPPIDTSQASRPERQRRAKLIPACCNVVRLASSEASRQSPKCKGRRANVNDETRVSASAYLPALPRNQCLPELLEQPGAVSIVACNWHHLLHHHAERRAAATPALPAGARRYLGFPRDQAPNAASSRGCRNVQCTPARQGLL